jgi:hypothetical protein
MVWVGKAASKQERRQSLSMAAKYLQANNLPPTTPISSCMEGGDNEVRVCLIAVVLSRDFLSRSPAHFFARCLRRPLSRVC